MFKNTTRRSMVLSAAAAGASLALPASALAQASSAAKTPLVGPLAPNPAEFRKNMEQFTGGKPGLAEGLQLEVPVLADNPSAVPVKVKVTLPITEQDWCEEIIVLAELNPSPLTCRMQFTAAAGTAEAAVRIRLSQSQTVYALARMKSGKILVAKQATTVAASGCGM
ncbi:thiosulfate oxidation carrier protein SoxY [Comamonas testosteroni]|uniref:thiosulfate oxidation carrier protein SoxY n=1 Tax=Comamonas testosteroni TaxID=285 RepID=UPI00265F1FD0|nr:thiosulfate oxidation carrier protein SoxY [Comamonas testosteroni]WKL14181.1 thiosulfate oxidation carrier protein SoxY [Comamonas testosteroni]